MQQEGAEAVLAAVVPPVGTVVGSRAWRIGAVVESVIVHTFLLVSPIRVA